MAAKKAWGIAIKRARRKETEHNLYLTFHTYVSPYRKGETFLTNESLRRAINRHKLKEDKLGIVAFRLNKTLKQVRVVSMLPIGAGKGIFSRLGLGRRIELILFEALKEKYPDYRYFIKRRGQDVSAPRKRQHQRLGLKAGQSLPLDEYCQKLAEEIKAKASKARTERKKTKSQARAKQKTSVKKKPKKKAKKKAKPKKKPKPKKRPR